MTQQQQLQEEREAKLYRALDECYAHGVSQESLRTLIYETGARWMPHGTLKQVDTRASSLG